MTLIRVVVITGCGTAALMLGLWLGKGQHQRSTKVNFSETNLAYNIIDDEEQTAPESLSIVNSTGIDATLRYRGASCGCVGMQIDGVLVSPGDLICIPDGGLVKCSAIVDSRKPGNSSHRAVFEQLTYPSNERVEPSGAAWNVLFWFSVKWS